MSSATAAEPTNPVAPVMNTRMGILLQWARGNVVGPASSLGISEEGAREPAVINAPHQPPRRRSRPTPPGFAAIASTARRQDSRGDERPTTCQGSAGWWATGAAATPGQPALAWPRADLRQPIGWTIATA